MRTVQLFVKLSLIIAVLGFSNLRSLCCFLLLYGVFPRFLFFSFLFSWFDAHAGHHCCRAWYFETNDDETRKQPASLWLSRPRWHLPFPRFPFSALGLVFFFYPHADRTAPMVDVNGVRSCLPCAPPPPLRPLIFVVAIPCKV